MTDLTFSADGLVEAVARRVVELLDEREKLAAQEPEGFIDVDTAAEFMAAKRSRVWDLCASGALRHVRDGRRVLTRRSWVSDYLASQDGER
jgi:excisionase family DNA binding protein